MSSIRFLTFEANFMARLFEFGHVFNK